MIGRENVKVITSQEDEQSNNQKLQTFIERNGKPCCLNLITERDVKFLKSIERDKKRQAADKTHQSIPAEEGKEELKQEDDEDVDEVTKIIRREEEEVKRRETEDKERKRVEGLESE